MDTYYHKTKKMNTRGVRRARLIHSLIQPSISTPLSTRPISHLSHHGKNTLKKHIHKTHLVGDRSYASFQLETFSEARLEVLRAAQALHPTAHHDADALAQGLALLHAMGCQYHGTFLVLCHDPHDHVPHEPPRHGVHAGAWLV